MKNHILSVFFIIIMMHAVGARAVPAKQGVHVIQMPDGSELRVRISGDESAHQYYTEDGYPLVEDGDYLYYGDIDEHGENVNFGIKACAKGKRSVNLENMLGKIDIQGLDKRVAIRASKISKERKSLGKFQSSSLIRHISTDQSTDDIQSPPYKMGPGLFTDIHFPAYGSQKAIVILVEYQDIKFNFSDTYDPIDYFTRMLNQDGFSDYGGTGCAAEYFRLNSNGNFLPEFDVYGPITLSQKRSYYGGNDAWGDDKNPADMVKEACEQLDDIVDFSDYDRDNDGVVDNVFLFYAGKGEASGGGRDTVWPHSWDMVSAGYPELMFDGVRIHTYGCTNELEGGKPDGVGTFIHEFSHVLGLPDLYVTSYSSGFTPGPWSVLDYGPYNNDGRTPPLYSAFERYALGWIEPLLLNESAQVTLEPISSNVCAMVATGDENEYFLLENRQQEGWDAYLPGHGMLVWHIDYDKEIWDENEVNNTAYHQHVDLLEADGRQTSSTRSGDSYPGVSGITELTANTSPALRTWDGRDLNCEITEIEETDNGNVRFNVYCDRSAIEDVEMDSIEVGINVEGLTVTAAEKCEIHACDLAGRWVAHGIGTVTLPGSGLYLITVPACKKTFKIFVKSCFGK